MVNLLEVEQSTHPKIVTEVPGGVTVGRIVLPVVTPTVWEASPTFLRFFNVLSRQRPLEQPNPHIDLRRSLLFSLNNNTANQHESISHGRPVSAYFTYNPRDEVVIIEWGTINPATGNAKLHTYLNNVIDYQDRVRQGMKLSSGHVAKIVGEEYTYLALIDNLLYTNTHIQRDEPMGKLVNALHFGGLIPITSDGYIQLPAFKDGIF